MLTNKPTDSGESTQYQVFASTLFKKHSTVPNCSPRIFCDGFRELDLESEEDNHRIYDPFCGNGFGLSALSLYHHRQVSTLYGSDIDGKAVMTAKRNLALTSLQVVIKLLTSSRDAPKCLASLAQNERTHSDLIKLGLYMRESLIDLPIWSKLFTANALNDSEVRNEKIPAESLSLIMTDPPYGRECGFTGINPLSHNDPAELIRKALEVSRDRLRDNGLAGIVFNDRSDQDERRQRIIDILKKADGYKFVKVVQPDSFLYSGRSLFVLKAMSCT